MSKRGFPAFWPQQPKDLLARGCFTVSVPKNRMLDVCDYLRDNVRDEYAMGTEKHEPIGWPSPESTIFNFYLMSKEDATLIKLFFT